MIQPIQIFGWIILVIIPIIFFAATKADKTEQLKQIKRIICFVLIGIFGLGIISSLLSLFQIRGISITVWQLLNFWGFRPSIASILFAFLFRFQWYYSFYWSAGRFIFPLLNLLFNAGIIFFFVATIKQLNQGDTSLATGGNISYVQSAPNVNYELSNKIESKFSGGVLPIFLFSIWSPLLLIITLGFATPFITCTVIRWICDNTSIGGKNYRFKGTAMGLFGRWILWYLLTIITLGIYGFWFIRNQIRWVVENIEMTN